MRLGLKTGLAACALMLGPAGLLAQDQPGAQPEQQQAGEAQPAAEQAAGLSEAEATRQAAQQGLIRANETIGNPVQDEAGEKLGTVEELAIGTDRGQIGFVIVSFGGWFGMGDSLVAVPFQAFQPNEAGEALITTLSKDQLKQAPAFKSGDWPDLTSKQWAQGVYAQFDEYEPYWQSPQPEAEPGEAGAGEQPEAEGEATWQGEGDQPAQAEGEAEAGQAGELAIVRCTELMGKEVASAQPAAAEDDGQLGQVTDLIVDTREGRIAYAILGRGAVMGIGGDLVAVPYSALSWEPQQERFTLDTDTATLDALAFKSDSWPDLTSEQWAARVHRQFDRQPYWQVFGYGAFLEKQAGAQPQQILQNAGLDEQQISELEQAGFQRDQVEQALSQAYQDQGMSADQADRKARKQAQKIDQSRQEGGQPEAEPMDEGGEAMDEAERQQAPADPKKPQGSY